MTTTLTYRDRIRRFIYFFPFRLLVLHFKKNHLLLLCWLILFGYVAQAISVNYGIPYLVLAPEYYGEVNFVSFLITGIALGGFITAFNLYSYALHAFRFPFIATVSRPFAKFCINNGIIPLAFLIAYIYSSVDIQVNHELIDLPSAILNIIGFLVGVFSFILLSYLYFTRTNTDIIKILGTTIPEPKADSKKKSEGAEDGKWFKLKRAEQRWHVETYMAKPYRIALARTSSHYEPELVKRILWQNHINGSLFEVLLVLSFLSLGAFGGSEFFTIPAGASIFMLFTTFLMVISAVFSWFKGWTLTILIGLFLVADQLSIRNEHLFYDSHAIGMNYDAPRPAYNVENLAALASDSATYEQDRLTTLSILESWKAKNVRHGVSNKKPKLNVIAVSGGGSRSMLWTFRSLQVADSLLNGSLMDRTALMTGSSGGLIGASYFRELYRRESHGEQMDRADMEHLNKISHDILNPIGFSLVTNDLFIRYRKVMDGDKTYTRDRGYAFEEELNQNLDGLLDIRLDDLADDERSARIPMLMITPTIINDGRRLLISTQPTSYMSDNFSVASSGDGGISGTVDYNRLFEHNEAAQLKLTSALRMSATFPYIMPLVTLPSDPVIQVMDAGVRDNYGMESTLEFIHEFRDWISDNTSGVVILQIRDRHKNREPSEVGGSLMKRFSRPVQNVTGNMLRVQDMEQDELFEHALTWADFPLERVSIELEHDHEENISLSWHLTANEKGKVLEQVHSEVNEAKFQRLVDLLSVDEIGSLITAVPNGMTAGLPSGPSER